MRRERELGGQWKQRADADAGAGRCWRRDEGANLNPKLANRLSSMRDETDVALVCGGRGC